MKTITKRFLKASVAMLLVVIMLFGTTISGFAAVVDYAQTRATYNHSGGHLYFVKPSTWSNASYIVGHDSYFRVYPMTKLSGNLYYLNAPSFDGWNGWGFVDTATATTGGKIWDNYTNYTHYTALHTSYQINGNTCFCTGSSTNGNGFNPTYLGNNYTDVTKYSQKAYAYFSNDGGTTYTNGTTGGTVTVQTYQLSGNGTGSSATTSASSSASRDAVVGSSVTMTATAKDGYDFVGWFSSTTATTATSQSTSYTYNNTAAKTLYARFKKASSNVTVQSADTTMGTVSGGGTGSSTNPVSITATPKEGYVFVAWEGGTAANFGSGSNVTASDTYTPTTDTTLTATFAKATYTVNFYDYDGTTKLHNTQTVEHGEMPEIPENPTREGYTFTGWNPSVDVATKNIDYVATYTINTYNLTMATRVSTDGGDTYTESSAGGTAIAYEGDDETKTITQYEYNKEFNIKAVANTGYRFAGWSDDQNPDQIKSTNAATTGRLKRDNTVYYANFVKTENVNIDITDGVDSITYSYGNVTETVDVDTPITVDYGTEVTFTVTPADTYIKGTWTVNGATFNDETLKVEVIGETTVSHTPIKTWAVTVTESEADKGTVLLGGEEVTSATVNNGGTITLKVTPNTDYIANITVDGNAVTLVNNETTLTITKDTVVVVTYTDVSCKYVFDTTEKSLVLGEEYTQTVRKTDDYCQHTINYSSNAENIATVDPSTGEVTAVSVGEAIITASCESGKSVSYTVTVLAPTVKLGSVPGGININTSAAITGSYTVENAPYNDNYTVSYSVVEGTATIENSTVLFTNPGTIKVKVDVLYNGESVASNTITYDVLTPTLTLSNTNFKLFQGHNDYTVTITEVSGTPEITWNSDATTVALPVAAADSKSALISTGIATGNANITVSAKYNDEYTLVKTITVGVIEPTVDANPSALTLQYANDASVDKTGTFTVSTNLGSVVGSCDNDEVTVESADTSVATVAYNKTTGKVTVTANSVGETTVTVNFHGKTDTVKITVNEADLYEYVYVTYNGGINDGYMHIYYWDDGQSAQLASMVYLGYNDNGKVYGYRFKKGETPDNFLFKPYGGTADYDFKYQSVNVDGFVNGQAYYFKSNNETTANELGTWTIDLRPCSISIEDVNITTTTTAEPAIETDSPLIKWSVGSTSIATISSSTTSYGAAPTVTGVAAGTTTLTARAYANTTSLVEMSTASNAYPYLTTTATATITVERDANDKRVDIYLSQGLYTMVDGVTAEIVGQTKTSTLTSNQSSGQVSNHEKANFYDNNELLGSVIEIKYTESNEDYEVAYIVVYNFNEQMFKIYEAEDMGTYVTANHLVTDSCYIYPVFFHTEEFITTNKLKKLTFSFDTTELPIEEWGMFVSCYAYDEDTSTGTTQRFLGKWPGQLMIPNEAGTRFWTQIEVPDTEQGSTYAYQPNGILFSNYLDGTIPQKYSSAFGFETSTCLQTYDYREGVTLLEEGYDEIFFKAQENYDGYHGDNPAGSYDVDDGDDFDAKNHNPAYTYEYLLHRDQVHAMDFFGQVVPDADKKTLENADYYIISEGDVTYSDGSYKVNNETIDSEFNGTWCVNWHVYKSDGTHLVTLLSDTFYNVGSNTEEIPLMVQRLMAIEGKTADDYRGKTIAISYEKENNNGHAGDCYDGQWYGIRSTDTMDVSVEVGLIPKVDDQGAIEESLVNLAGSNESYYGKGGIVSDSDLLPTKQLTYGGDRSVDLKANKVGNYKFVGWYEFDGYEYCRIDTAPTHTVDRVPNTVTYYALFEELGETDVIITHAKYNNQYTDIANEPVQEHNGDSLMSVTVYDNKDQKFVHEGGTANMTSTTATFTAVEGHTYTVTITTVPVGPDTFFAWYSNSFTADDKPTYEEVFTREEDNGSNEMVSNTFIYDPAKNKNKEINIYSDLVNVTADATLEYVYQNRYGATRVIRETIHLTDEEIEGFAGNYDKKSGKNIPYCPAFNNYYYYDKNTVYYDKSQALENGSEEELNTGNQIIEHAPNKLVTEAVHQNISWNAEETRENRLTVGPSLVTLIADQPPVQYEVTYKIGDEQAVSTGKLDYNTLLDITAPISQNDVSFSYWIDLKTGEIISYNPYYAYRIVEDRDIQAVYGATNYDPWTSVIENVTQTREYQNYPKVTDIVYVDFLLAFHNNKQLRLNDLGDSVQYGLVMIREDGVEVNDSNKNSVAYPSTTTSDNIISKVETVVSRNLASARFQNTAKDTYYYATHYNLTGSENVTNLNRLNFVLSFDNNGTEYYKRAFSAYAYIIADGETYISKVNDFNIYETATEKLTLSTIGG